MNNIKAIIFDLGGVLLNLDIARAMTNMHALGVDKTEMDDKIIDLYQTGSILTHGIPVYWIYPTTSCSTYFNYGNEASRLIC